MRLNKYLAHCGICTRKEGEALIKKGLVKVNDHVMLLPHHEVAESDIVKYRDSVVEPKQNFEYYVINKSQKTMISASEKSHKPTVHELLKKSTSTPLTHTNKEPENNFCGLLVMTSDTKLVEHLSSESHKLKSTYQCVLDHPYDSATTEKIAETIKEKYPNVSLLGIGFPEEDDKKTIGIDMVGGNAVIWTELLSSYGYAVQKIDCTFYGGITKKDLKRDWSRKLTEKEVVFLKHFSS